MKARDSILAWFAANSVAANLLMLLIFLGGYLSLLEVDKQAYPRFNPTEIWIEAEYPGAAPAEVEAGVCVPIEEAIYDLDGIKKLETTALNGKCQIQAQVQQDKNIQDLSSAIHARIQTLNTLPKAIEKIIIDDTAWEYPAISVVVTGKTDQMTLRHWAERIRNEMNHLPEVRLTRLWNTAKYQMTVEIPSERLKQYHLTLEDISNAIAQNSLDISSGFVKADTGELQLRSKSTVYEREQLFNTVLSTEANGAQLKLVDIAQVYDEFNERNFGYFSNGQPSETIGAMTQHDLVETAEAVRRYVDALQPDLPEGIEVFTRRDNARSFTELLDTLVVEGISGFFLVLGVLMLFLSTQVAIWAAVGILISVFGALWLMPVVGVTLNMLSLFGFVLAMGVLVDDAIIVSERIHELQQQGYRGLKGAIRGVHEVAVPVILGVSIGLIAFLPGFFVPPSWALGFMKPVAVVMILSLAFSLVEALFILPAHLAHESRSKFEMGALTRVRAFLNSRLDKFRDNVYVPILKSSIEWRYSLLSLFSVLLLLGWVLVHTDSVKISLEEDVSYDNFHVHLQPPQGTPYAETQKKVGQFVNALKQAEAELNQLQAPGLPSAVEGVDLIVNETDPQVYVEFSSAARQQFHIRDLIKRWYSHIQDMGDFRPNFHTPTEQDVVDLELELASADPAALNSAVDKMKVKLASFPGIIGLEDSRRPGIPELRMRLTPEAEHLGLTLDEVSSQVRHAFFGKEVQRFMRGREEVRIVLSYPKNERTSILQLKNLPITLKSGKQVPLNNLVTFEYVPGFGALKRENRHSLVSLQVRMDEHAPMNGDELYQNLQRAFIPELQASNPSLEISAGAAKEEADLIMESLKQNTLIALMAIYALIAVSFRSYLQPLLFMLSVPIAWLGALLIHWALDITLSFQSIVGMVAASGVVVNDSIVLLDFIQKRREQLTRMTDLIIDACIMRFRPIILVSLTNLAGFFPMLFETSEQAKFLVPMTLSLSFGLFAGMFATLLLTPICYAVLEDIKTSARLVKGRTA